MQLPTVAAKIICSLLEQVYTVVHVVATPPPANCMISSQLVTPSNSLLVGLTYTV